MMSTTPPTPCAIFPYTLSSVGQFFGLKYNLGYMHVRHRAGVVSHSVNIYEIVLQYLSDLTVLLPEIFNFDSPLVLP